MKKIFMVWSGINLIFVLSEAKMGLWIGIFEAFYCIANGFML